MSSVSMTDDPITYDLNRTRQFAITSAVIGLFVGGAVALAIGGSIAHQVAILAPVAVTVTGSLYRLLCRLATAVTGGTGYYRISNPARMSPSETATGSGVRRPNARDQSLVDDR